MRMFGRITPAQERERMLNEASEEACKQRWLATHAFEVAAYHRALADMYELRHQRLLAQHPHNNETTAESTTDRSKTA